MEEQTQKPTIISDNMFGLYVLSALVFPLLSFSIIPVLNDFSPEWQNGQVFTYVILFLSPKASWVFFPLITYSVLSLLLLYGNNSKYTRFFVRLGVYTGTVLSLQYSIILIIAFSWYVVIAWVTPFILFYTFKFLYQKAGEKTKRILNILALVIAFLLLGFCFIKIGVETLLFLVFFFCVLIVLFSNPFWAFLIFLKTSFTLLKYYEQPSALGRKIAGTLSWFALYGMIMKINVLRMYEMYASLPVESPPRCYIATAAAQGHPRIVRSGPVSLKDGNIIWVNPQLQHFKAFEIAVMAVFPKLHHLIRKIYDVIGKKLAARIRNPFLADVAFLLLLPVEWVSFFVLKLVIPEIELISKKIYHS